MAKYELKFVDHFQDGAFIKCENLSFSDLNEEDVILIRSKTSEGDTHICLDKSTAIKFAKTLRTEINKMEVQDGK